MDNHCIICHAPTTELYDEQLKVTYDVCHKCDFISKQNTFHLSLEEEQKRYDSHNNDEESEGYLNIFRNLLNFHVRPLKSVKNILDYGSGPYPMLQKVFDKEGYDITLYDPFYHNDLSFKNKKYDAVVSTEVFEHFVNPIKELDTIIPLIKQNGYLIVMTHFRPTELTEFTKWWYRRDPTHIVFYNQKTFHHIAKKYGLIEIENNDKHTIVLQKQ